MSSPVQVGRPAYLPIHHGELAPAPVLCRSTALSTPRSTDWAVVTCRACLGAGVAAGSAGAVATLARREADDAAEADD